MTDTIVLAEDGGENTGYKFSWGLAIAGGVAATAVTFFLLSLGSGFGLLLVHPMTHSGPSAPAFLTGGAIYFLCAQAFGFAVGGHLVGRLLGPLAETCDREMSLNAHAPYVIGDSASERFDANYIVAPLPERLPALSRHCELPLGSLWRWPPYHALIPT